MQDENFIYDGYQIAAFPDIADKLAPKVGYLPGHLPWYQGKKLEALGVTIINKISLHTCHIDRRLISGASPLASNEFGKLAARTLLEATRKKS